jgi:hypothetical protein
MEWRRMELAENLYATTLKLAGTTRALGEHGVKKDPYMEALHSIIDDQVEVLKRLVREASELAGHAKPYEIGPV